jgi:hypothetical protein
MVKYSAVVVNHGVHPSGSLIQWSGSSKGIFLLASATLLRDGGFHINYLGHAHLDTAIGASKGKLADEHALLRSLHGRLKWGDTLLADAYYSSLDEVMALKQMGVDVAIRQTSNRRTDFRRGTRLGHEDHLVEWHRHRNRRKWMSRETFAALPRVFLMRELWVRGGRRGFRTKEFVVVTSLVDASKHPRTELAELYRARWHAELDIRSIKQTMWIDLLRCKTPKLVRKEIWAHLLMCNLICGAMAEAARRHNVMPRQLSLQGAWQTLKAFRAELTCVPTGVALAMTEVVLGAIAFHRVGNRPDRVEPRVIKRRLKAYPRMQVARRLARKRLMKVAWDSVRAIHPETSLDIQKDGVFVKGHCKLNLQVNKKVVRKLGTINLCTVGHGTHPCSEQQVASIRWARR